MIKKFLGVLTYMCIFLGGCLGMNNPLLGDDSAAIKFGQEISNGTIEENAIFTPFQNLNIAELQSLQQKIFVMKNLALASYYVPVERTDFQGICSPKMVELANTIEVDATVNLKIILLLFYSQVELKGEYDPKNAVSFKKEARKEIIESMIGRFAALVNGDAQKAVEMKNKFYELMKSDSRFACYCVSE
jgi:hypothetical protein